MKNILVVCTANICRSPMAAALLRRRISDLGLADRVEVRSAGVRALDGHAASKGALTAMADLSLSLDEHSAQQVTGQLLAGADIVLVMEEEHRETLFHFAPRALAKVFLLSEMAGEHDDVDDPYGGSAEDYQQTVQRMMDLIDKGMPSILRRLNLEDAVAATGIS